MFKKHLTKVGIVFFLLAFISLYFYFDVSQYFNLEYIKSQKENWLKYYIQNPFTTIVIYFIIYIMVTALSLPGAAFMTLLGGAIFGLWKGTLIVSFASTIGATCSFLVARFLLKESIQKKFSDKLKTINEGIEKDGKFYLFTLRLIPAIPFFVINLVMGLTPIKTFQFFYVSQIGMLAGTIVYVNAGTELAKLNSLSGILSPSLLLSFVVLGLFPIIAKKLIGILKNNSKRESST